MNEELTEIKLKKTKAKGATKEDPSDLAMN